MSSKWVPNQEKPAFSTGIDIFINTVKTEILPFLIDSPVQCCPEKASFMQNFLPWYSMERFSE